MVGRGQQCLQGELQFNAAVSRSREQQQSERCCCHSALQDQHLFAGAAGLAGGGPAPQFLQSCCCCRQVLALPEMLDLTRPAAAALAQQQPVPDLPQQVVDARPAGRFKGADPEPRAGLKSGHMPGAKSVPFVQVSSAGHPLGPWTPGPLAPGHGTNASRTGQQ